MRVIALLALVAGATVSQEPGAIVDLARRESTEAVFTFEVADGFHVQANPVPDEFLIPTSLSVGNGCGVTIGSPRYPPARSFRLEGTERDLAVWDGTFDVAVPMRAGRFARRGECTLYGTLVFQACDLRTCLVPATLEVVLPIRIR